jgi:hypothetical protein
MLSDAVVGTRLYCIGTAVTRDTDMRMQEIVATSTAYSCFVAMKAVGHCQWAEMWGAEKDRGAIRKWFGQRQPRGAAVPFEAPALRSARVCDDERDGLIAVLRDFANNGSSYIVPWTSLPLMATMTDHDMALHTAVCETRASTPEKVREVISDLALSGALGLEAKADEIERTKTDRAGLADVELVLILYLLDSCGVDLTTLVADPARWRDIDSKDAVAAAAAAVGIRRQDIYRRIAEFARLLAPVGLMTTEGAIQSGWLRALHCEIEGFSQYLATQHLPDIPDADRYLAAIADSAERTARLSAAVFGMLDYAVLDIAGTVRRWTTGQSLLRQAIDRLSLMLDEWPFLIKSAHDVLRGSPDELHAKLRVLASIVPRTPEPDRAGVAPESDSDAGSSSVSNLLGARLATIWSMLRASRSVRQ